MAYGQDVKNEARHLPRGAARRAEVRHGLSVPTGKPVGMAASGHPAGAKTGTNHARPTSRPPAQPGACARHAGNARAN